MDPFMLPPFLTDIFCDLLGYAGQAEATDTYTLSRERRVEADRKLAYGVLGRFQNGKEQFIAVLEAKSTRDPLDRQFASRRMHAVDQAYGYAIHLPCAWVIVNRNSGPYDN
jgi:predicted secreted protein